MDVYLYSLDLPFTGIKLLYRELTAKEHLQLSKAHFLIPQEDQYLSDYGRVVQDVVKECVKNKEDFYKINIVEYVLFLCKLRTLSIGEDTELEFKNPSEESKEEKLKITFNFQEFARNLFLHTSSILKKDIIETPEMTIQLSWPLVTAENVFLQRHHDIILDSTIEYIDEIIINDVVLKVKEYSFDQKTILYDKIPSKIQNKIQERVLLYIQKLSEPGVFNERVSEYLSFNFYNFSYQNTLRLFFTENLKNLYTEYYILASKNISISDINKMTIAEKNTFMNFIKEESNQNEEEPGEWVDESE